jgi:hypothetical integral membrane protein (TIGR02206 family)
VAPLTDRHTVGRVAGTFVPYGASHAAAAAVGVVGAVGIVVLGRRVRGRPVEERVSRGFALLLAAFTIPLQVRQWLPANFEIRTSIPLQICDLAWMVAVYALWTRGRRTSALLYYWALTLSTQAVVTPTLGKDFPSPDFVMYWGMHLMTIWAALYVTFGLGVRPDWRCFRFAVLCTAVWVAVAMTFNALTGTNYGYLARKPDVSTPLDYFGPWPLYVVVLVAVVLGGWALITWPWVAADRRAAARERHPVPPTG